MSQFRIILSNGYCAPGSFYENPVADFFKKSLKHLQHITVPTNPRDYLYYIDSRELLVDKFIDAAKTLSITIEVARLNSQDYLNELHVLYEQGYPKDRCPDWLPFHELLHSIEAKNDYNQIDFSRGFLIDYRHYAGPLEQALNREYLKLAVTKFNPGVCYAPWMELGKVPMQYWLDGEPSDVNRVCALAKPWLMLKPSMFISFDEVDLMPTSDQIDNFMRWFYPYKDAWMKKYNINELLVHDYYSRHVTLQGGKIPIGEITHAEELNKEIAQGNYAVKVELI